MRRYSDGRVDATPDSNQDAHSRPKTPPTAARVSLLAHGGTGIINTWGFAYVGGVIGLFTVSLLYVKSKLTTNDRSQRAGLASLGPVAILIGGLCGVSLGLGTATILDSQLDDDVEASEVVAALCERRAAQPDFDDGELHDDIEHLIDDLDAPSARAAHQTAHDVAPSDTATSVGRLIDELVTAANGNADAFCTD